MQYDLLIKNGYVVDYASAREGYFDVAVQNGMIAAVESSIGGNAVRELDASGKLVLPGLVDSHVHASAWLGGSYGPHDAGQGWCDQCFGYVGAGDQCTGAGA